MPSGKHPVVSWQRRRVVLWGESKVTDSLTFRTRCGTLAREACTADFTADDTTAALTAVLSADRGALLWMIPLNPHPECSAHSNMRGSSGSLSAVFLQNSTGI